jgi:hypothetical protein
MKLPETPKIIKSSIITPSVAAGILDNSPSCTTSKAYGVETPEILSSPNPSHSFASVFRQWALMDIGSY